MNDSKISVRYAKALFESASEQKVLDHVRKDMEEVQSICAVSEFEYLVSNPVMKESDKCDALAKVLGEKIHPLSKALLDLVFKNGREQFIQAIARNFIGLYKKEKGIKSVTFSTATVVTNEIRTKVEKIIQEALNSPVELQSEKKDELIGGFVVRIEDQQYDASVATSLKKVRKQLLN